MKRESLFSLLQQPWIFAEVAVSMKPQSIHQLAKGLRGLRGVESIHAAVSRANTIPAPIRNLGLASEWRKPLHNGHIEPVSLNPRLASDPSNQTWEIGKNNLRTGNRPKSSDYWRENGRQLGRHTARVLAKDAFRKAGAGFLWGALLEAPIALLEEAQSVRRGEKTTRGAFMSGGKKTLVSGGVGALSGLTAWGLTAAGITVSSAVILPLSIVGGSAYLVGSSLRVWKALKGERCSVLTSGMKQYLLSCGDLSVVGVAAKVVSVEIVY
jgi:hypothetical protein